jgi:hypothetical protein
VVGPRLYRAGAKLIRTLRMADADVDQLPSVGPGRAEDHDLAYGWRGCTIGPAATGQRRACPSNKPARR